MSRFKVGKLNTDHNVYIFDTYDNTYEHIPLTDLITYQDIIDYDWVKIGQIKEKISGDYTIDNNSYIFSKCKKLVVERLPLEEILFKKMLSDNKIINYTELSDITKIDGSIVKRTDNVSNYIFAEVDDYILHIYTDCYKIMLSGDFLQLLQFSDITELCFDDFLIPNNIGLGNYFSTKLQKIDFSKTSLKYITNFDNFFSGLTKLKTVLFNPYDEIKPYSTYRMFADCLSLEYVDMTGFDIQTAYFRTNDMFVNTNIKAVLKNFNPVEFQMYLKRYKNVFHM